MKIKCNIFTYLIVAKFLPFFLVMCNEVPSLVHVTMKHSRKEIYPEKWVAKIHLSHTYILRAYYMRHGSKVWGQNNEW